MPHPTPDNSFASNFKEDRKMLHGIQACRAIAALLVVLFHSSENLAKEKYFGHAADYLANIFWFGGQAGVAFFFVLSGFIIHHIHANDFNQPKRLLIYAKKRIIRIYPTYFIIFLMVYFAAYATPSLRDSMPTSTIVLLKSLLLIPQDIRVVGGTGAPVIVVAWSLQYEVFFYAIFALALLRREFFYMACAAIAAYVCAESIWGSSDFPGSFFANNLILLFGMGIISSATLKGKLLTNFPGYLACGAALGFIFVAIYATKLHERESPAYIDLLYGVFSAILICSLAQHETKSGTPKILMRAAYFGESSYALYLLHFPLIAILSKIAVVAVSISKIGAMLSLVLLVLLSIIAAVFFNIRIEQPILRKLGKRI